MSSSPENPVNPSAEPNRTSSSVTPKSLLLPSKTEGPSPRPTRSGGVNPPRSDRSFFRRHSSWVIWLSVIVALLLIGGCLFYPRQKPTKKAAGGGAIPVSVAAVQKGNIDIILNALGIVTPVYTVTVTSRVAGEITEVDYQEGQTVKKNDLLLVIDPRPYAAAVAQAKGQLARDQALLENARLDLERYQDAFKAHAIPEQQIATQQALVKEDEGTVQLDQGNLDAAQVNLDYTQIRSPIAGRVGLRSIDPGNIVAAGGTVTLATITQFQPITVIFSVAEDYLNQITPELQTDRPLRVDVFDRTQQTKIAQGVLNTLDNQINTATGTVRARATFSNSKNELFPNQFVNAKLYIKTLSQVDLVPTAAIQRNDAATFVYVIQPNNTVKSQPITVTATEGQSAAVTGLNVDDSLVVDGFDKLQDGSKIMVRKPGEKPKTNNGP